MTEPTPIRPVSGSKMKDLRDALTEDQRKIVRAIAGHIECELIESLPEINAGVRTSAAQGSFTATVQIRKANKRFQAKVSARVRTPREPLEIDLHIAEDGQLALGLGPDDDETEDDE